MVRHYRSLKKHFDSILDQFSEQELVDHLKPKNTPLPPRVRGSSQITESANDYRWNLIPTGDKGKNILLDPTTISHQEKYQHNIENFIGTVKVPIGLAGPLRVNGMFAQGDYYIPLATTEAALVASYNRGAQLISEAGGCTTILISEGVSRAPGFCFRNVIEAGKFIQWCLKEVELFRKEAEATTRFGKLNDMKISIEGNNVYLNFEYITGDASGQNMVTIATDAILSYIVKNSPVKPEHYFIEANLSGDKKSHHTFLPNCSRKKNLR